MVPVGPSPLRSDLVEPTKDDPEMLQRDTHNFNAINQCRHLRPEMWQHDILAKQYFGKMIFWQNTTCGNMIFWQNDILANQYFAKIIFWQSDILGYTMALFPK